MISFAQSVTADNNANERMTTTRMITTKVPKDELTRRIKRFSAELDKVYDNWELCAITGNINIFYLTGTVCDGVLMIRRGDAATLWVRKSYERALLESEFDDIRPMRSFRDVAAGTGPLPETLYLDTAQATLEWYGLLNKHMCFNNVMSADKAILTARAVKSEYEIERMRIAGDSVNRILNENLISLLYEGISEVEFGVKLFSLYMDNGHHGICRFSMRGVETFFGHIAFGDSTLYPSAFDGASGIAGICPAVPVLGSRERLLREGDLMFVDSCFGVDGYHIDKTLIYSYKRPQAENVIAVHRHCLEIEALAASMLRTGVKPSDIYQEALKSVKPELLNSFMGAPGRTVSFLGHGIGLNADEMPVLARGFDEPLEAGMTIAIEPKIGIEGVGMVGSENTYLVTDNGGVCLTGSAMDIVVC